jgi:2-polyprenyl-3-methyl-5-hydroxy-6-metoxy-1,4-benzoquinol methylase/tRNA A-37 threonylcarbamoyl transferase component Bud32
MNSISFHPKYRQNSTVPCANKRDRYVLKTYRDKPLTIKSLKYWMMAAMGFDIPVEYRSNEERRCFEQDCLLLWREKGFRVPDVYEITNGSSSTNIALAMSFLDGPTLDTILRDKEVSIGRKREAVSAVIEGLRERHVIALYEEEHRLIHFDSNMRNIVITEDGPAWLDFEMGRVTEKINRSAAREVNKLFIEIANALGKEHLPRLVSELFVDYGIIHILRTIADAEIKRPFGSIHRMRDAKKKLQRPDLVTKQDLADAIQKRLTAPWNPGEAKGGNQAQVEMTSWDGKFYQSFNDADPRGRDMPHRYRIMQFPQSFLGKTILDIGCNLGRCCIDAAKRGARRSVGIDHRPDVMVAVTQYCREHDINADFHPFDINKGAHALQRSVGQKKFDYVCVLSIWSHVDQSKLWEIINTMCAEVCYFEDNSPSRVKSLSKLEATLRKNLNFPVIEFLGFTTDRGVRAVFRLSKIDSTRVAGSNINEAVDGNN